MEDNDNENVLAQQNFNNQFAWIWANKWNRSNEIRMLYRAINSDRFEKKTFIFCKFFFLSQQYEFRTTWIRQTKFIIILYSWAFRSKMNNASDYWLRIACIFDWK